MVIPSKLVFCSIFPFVIDKNGPKVRHFSLSAPLFGPCGGICGSTRWGRVICREPRAARANAKANTAELARPAQTPKQMPQDLRRLRKRQGKCRGTRAACANVKANAAELARPAQTPKQMPREPQAGCANAKENAARTPSRLRDQTRINPAPRGARGDGAAHRPYGCFRARCGRARAAADCRGRKNAGQGCRTCRPARRP